MRLAPSRVGAWALVLAAGACAAPVPAPQVVGVDPPAAPGSFAPRLVAEEDGGLLLSWLEPLPDGHRFVVSRGSGETWSEPVEIARGADFFANWADTPGIGIAGDGTLLAHWLVRTGRETYAYSIFLARSADGGRSWSELGRLHDDGSATEHGFVSWAPEGEEARAVWLDGRAMAEGGAMALWTARVGAQVGVATMVDARVCECCSTDLAVTSGGPLAVYRDRSLTETRDIALARPGAGGTPVILHADGWQIAGCPVNGPAIDAAGDRVVVAWFTAAHERPSVQVALSHDAGETFSPPIQVHAGRPLGRVDVELDPIAGAAVSWLELAEDGDAASLLVRRIPEVGEPSAPVIVGSTAPSRASGFPRLASWGGAWVVAWVEAGAEGALRLRAARFDL